MNAKSPGYGQIRENGKEIEEYIELCFMDNILMIIFGSVIDITIIIIQSKTYKL